MRRVALITMALILALILAACGQAPPGTGGGSGADDGSGVTSGGSAAGADGNATATAMPGNDPDVMVSATVVASSDTGTIPEMPPTEPSKEIISRARDRLGKHLSVDPATLTIVRAQQRTWDESLGCPFPGRAYAEFAQFGYLIELQSGDKIYPVHSEQLGNFMLLCDDGVPISLTGQPLPGR